MPLSGNLLLNPSTLAFEIVHWILYSLLHRQPVVHTRFTKFTLNIWIDGGIQDVDMTFLIVLWGWNPEKMMWAVTKCLCWFNSTLQKVMSSVVCFLSPNNNTSNNKLHLEYFQGDEQIWLQVLKIRTALAKVKMKSELHDAGSGSHSIWETLHKFNFKQNMFS